MGATPATRRDQLGIFSADRLIAIIRTATPELAARAARAAAAGGVRLIEITLTVPDAFEVIASLAGDRALAASGAVIGAGTVLSPRAAEDACLAGARFLVSPIHFPELVTVAHAHDGLAVSGTLTPTEIVAAADAGADLIKVYPVETSGGAAYIASLTRALVGLPLIATGNIALDEVPAYLAAGVVGFGVGGPLIRPDLLARGDDAAVAAGARAFLAATRRS